MSLRDRCVTFLHCGCDLHRICSDAGQQRHALPLGRYERTAATVRVRALF